MKRGPQDVRKQLRSYSCKATRMVLAVKATTQSQFCVCKSSAQKIISSGVDVREHSGIHAGDIQAWQT